MHQFAVLVVFAVARSNEPGEDQRNHAALHVHHRGAGEVAVTVAEAKIRAELSQSAAAPHPVAEHGIHDGSDEAPVNHERGKFPTLGSGAGRDRCGCI